MFGNPSPEVPQNPKELIQSKILHQWQTQVRNQYVQQMEVYRFQI